MASNPLFTGVEGCAFVGMVHLLPLPGSPGWQGSMQAVLDAAQRDADALIEGGADALILENMGDVPRCPHEHGVDADRYDIKTS